ncbi:MAG: ABC transporter permease [Chloroflexota bacterium]|nr:ABC transporter permease [Chloroflexota bacterium]
MSQAATVGRPPLAMATGSERRVNQRAWWRLLWRDRPALLATLFLAAVVMVAVLAPVLAPHDPLATDTRAKAAPILTPGHPLGTDQLGRDILSRLLHGARLTLTIGIVGAAFSATVGLIAGVATGYVGGWFDGVAMRLIDVLLSFPDILLAVVIVAVLGPSLQNAIIAVSILGVPFYVRLIRSDVLILRRAEYVIAARTIGAPNRQIMLRHIVPNVLAPIIVTVSLHVGYLILAAAGLSFVGLGAQPPSPEWGAMVSSGRDYLLIEPHVVLIPAAAIFLVVLAFNVVGDGLRDALDPRAR